MTGRFALTRFPQDPFALRGPRHRRELDGCANGDRACNRPPGHELKNPEPVVTLDP